MPESSGLISIIKQFNQGSLADAQVPALRDEAGIRLARFRPITSHDMDDRTLLSMLTAWRKKHMSMFMTQFAATIDRTRDWLAGVTAGDDRVLFLIQSLDGQPLGQFGLRFHADRSMELDNGILGSTAGPAALFYHAERSLLQWAFETLPVPLAVARVFSKNVFAIKLHKRVGMTILRTESLSRVCVADGEHHYRTQPPGTETDVPFELITLGISRCDFRKLPVSAARSRQAKKLL